MKNKVSFITVALLSVFAVLSVSCVKEIESNDEKYRPEGTVISFAAATGYENGIATRTAYSDSLFGSTTKYERIDWEAQDPIKVYYAKGDATSVYYVGSGIKSENETSSADIQSSNTLTWAGGSGDHVFYAMYPGETFNGNSSASLVGSVVSGTIPRNQTVTKKTGTHPDSVTFLAPNMAYGYMVSKKTITANSTVTSVDLPFRPAMTAFQFRFRKLAGTGNVGIDSLKMTSTGALTGDFSFDMANGADADQRGSASWGDVTLTNTDTVIVAQFPTGTVLGADNAKVVDFTVFALPVDLTHITLHLFFSDGSKKKLALKRTASGTETWEPFTACKKYIISNDFVPGGDDWVYTLTEVDSSKTKPITPCAVTNMIVDTPATGHGGHIGHYPSQTLHKPFQSYKTNTVTNEQKLVDVVITYSPANEDGTCADDWSDSKPDWLESFSVMVTPEITAPTDSFSSAAVFAELPCDMTVMFDEIKEHTDELRGRSPNDFSSGEPQDLARYDIDKLTASQPNAKPKTANCYVVDRPGWYMFPLVYGNAIDWDVNPDSGWNPSSWRDNDEGYTYSSTSLTNVPKYRMPHFQNYVGAPVRSPYILDDINLVEGINLTLDDVEPVIVWEDAATPFILPVSLDTIVPYRKAPKYYAEDGTTTKLVPYIKFEVNANILQGNAMIALREKSGQQRIIWSWHIWVTDLDMGTLNVPQNGGAVASNDMMKYNLGWCDMRIGRRYSYAPRVWWVKIAQAEDASDQEPLVFQVAESLNPYYTLTLSSGTYYQMGRKDTFLPGTTNEGLTWGNWYHDFWVDYPTATFDNAELNVAPHTAGLPLMINKPCYAPIYTVTSGASAIPSPSVTESQDDMVHTIQNPYKFFSRNGTTTIGWLYNNRPWNLWSMYNQYNLQYYASSNPDTNEGAGIDSYIPHYENDIIVVKTIYDPCPPGFSVPNYCAFTGFTTTGKDIVYRDHQGSHATGDDYVPSDALHFPDLELYGDFRFYLSTSTPGQTICLPSHGARAGVNNAAVQDLFGGVYYLTSQKKGDRYVVTFSYWGPVGAGTARSTGYAVRAIKEQPRPGD